VLKKVKELTVEELLILGKADNVRELRITINGTDNPNKHFDVNIGGVNYGRRLFLEDEVDIPEISNLSYIFLFRLKHHYGKVKFVDKDNELLQITYIRDIPNIAIDFYHERVEYTELLPIDNPYNDEVVACIKFMDKTKEDLKNMR